MDTKLTVKLDKDIIQRAKQYANKKNISLSKIIEAYLNLLTREQLKEELISPLVQGLSGIITIPKDFDLQEDYAEFLIKKY
ncbi:MAG: hypothetical protein HN691_01860 [Bacteroidetes bacterium]|jgi:hypothetical protein|nr:hypothetical protein [Bacteroidota bacterium]